MDTTASTMECIDASIAKRNLLLHPFYQAWTQGKLPRPALRDYARQYYHHVAAFPTYLSALHAHTDDPQIRRHILANLIDEEAGRPNHPELWLLFAEGIGVSSDDVRNSHPWPETEALIRTFRRICGEGSVAQGLAALYAYEVQIPKIAESKVAGLETFYGVNDPNALAYFRVHIEADREHSRVERELLESCLAPEDSRDVTATVDTVLDSLWGLLSGVCRRHGIDC